MKVIQLHYTEAINLNQARAVFIIPTDGQDLSRVIYSSRSVCRVRNRMTARPKPWFDLQEKSSQTNRQHTDKCRESIFGSTLDLLRPRSFGGSRKPPNLEKY